MNETEWSHRMDSKKRMVKYSENRIIKFKDS